MLHLVDIWDRLDMDDLEGGLQVAMENRDCPPFILAYARSLKTKEWNWEIFTCPTIRARDLTEQPELVDGAENEVEALRILNGNSDAGTADILSDLAADGRAGGEHTNLVRKGTFWKEWTRHDVEAGLHVALLANIGL